MEQPIGQQPGLVLDGVGHHFGQRIAVEQVAVHVTHGVTGLLGVNGAGKSTLLRIAAGVLPPATGGVLVDGLDPYRRGQRSQALTRMALVPQEFDFPRRHTLGEFLHHMSWMRGVPRAARTSRVAEAAGTVDLGDRLGNRLASLSGGMLRRAAIAQALLGRPRVLLLDEPTTGLDPAQRAEVVELVQVLGESAAVLLASHVIEDVDFLAERVVVIHGGRIRFDGPTAGLRATGGQLLPGRSALEAGFLALVSGRTP